MTDRPDSKSRVFQFRLSAKDRERLDRLAKFYKLKKSEYVRRAVTGSLGAQS